MPSRIAFSWAKLDFGWVRARHQCFKSLAPAQGQAGPSPFNDSGTGLCFNARPVLACNRYTKSVMHGDPYGKNDRAKSETKDRGKQFSIQPIKKV